MIHDLIHEVPPPILCKIPILTIYFIGIELIAYPTEG